VGHLQVNASGLMDTARRLVGAGKGRFAMDESNGTCNKQFAALGIAQTEEKSLAYREPIVTTPSLRRAGFTGGWLQ
jgi:fructose-bisphosphate aldolase class I